ncbi:AP endonuclease [Candidatus Saganbacteria bacterium CG08_land_8_20_14_0_20_45_16]|uniref:AP endonuclease n=1 Tax=Candidatus Saganbacteria bacterium CG08_land_8_20_14_0_20_45_16 TaxID=2014293 RepID=A0A2H0XXP1_UNCSA|nr:MAG: AP endonuclease [Candidatus Saganbacteria bacterium CG08_land_8_20_14_0_20_45_16]
MFKFGLKLWSINDNYVKDALRLFNEGVYQYIELYVKPGSYEKFIGLWKNLPIPYVIHAPHFRDGMNLAKRENEAKNLTLIQEAQRFADQLKADKLIVHPGIAGDIKETARQLKLINDKRILIENKPYYALDDNLVCNGTTPEEIKLVMDEAGVGLCLDIGHAACSARAHSVYYLDYLKQFMMLAPKMFHLADGDVNNLTDDHRHIGEGNFDFRQILAIIHDNAMVTIEVNKSSKENLNDFIKDVKMIKAIKGVA